MLRLIKNARVYSPDRLDVRDVLIGGEKILAVEERIDLPKNLECETCDLGGDRLIPGFIDAHVHALGGGGESGPASRVPAVPLSHFTRHGVTTVVSVLGTDDLTRSMSSQITQVRSLMAEGLSAYCYTGGYHIPPTTLTGSARGDIVHVEQVIGIGELAISDHRSSQPTLEEFLRLASEAHVAGMMTGKAGILHLHMGDGERGLELVQQALKTAEIPSRVYNPAHCNRRKALFDDSCKLTKKGCSIDVGAFPVEEGEDALWAHEAILKYYEKGFDRRMITVSSDSGGCLPTFNDRGEVVRMEVGTAKLIPHALDELLKSGLALEDALPPFTTNAASLLRLPHKGRILAGCDADLIQLDDDNKIRSVMARGAWHVKDGEILRRGMFEG